MFTGGSGTGVVVAGTVVLAVVLVVLADVVVNGTGVIAVVNGSDIVMGTFRLSRAVGGSCVSTMTTDRIKNDAAKNAMIMRPN